MKLLANISFKNKLVLYALSTTCVALFLCVAAITATDWIQHHERVIRDLTLKADIMGANVTAAVAFDDPASAERALAAFGEEASVVHACVFDSEGRELATYGHNGSTHSSEHALPPPGHETTRGRIHLRRPILLDGEPIGFIYLDYELREFYRDLQVRIAVMVTAAILALIGAYFVSRLLQNALTRPLTDLVCTAATVTETQDYSIRAVKRSKDELGVLTDSLNSMLAGTEERDRELSAARESLEQRVRERTADLARKIGRAHV